LRPNIQLVFCRIAPAALAHGAPLALTRSGFLAPDFCLMIFHYRLRGVLIRLSPFGFRPGSAQPSIDRTRVKPIP
jgi:hypothetical protein